MTLEELMVYYGSDKNINTYASETYSPLFSPIKDEICEVLEIGIGTLDPAHPQSFAPILNVQSHYKQGGSLRAWRDFFPKAVIHGIDVAEDCIFEEERIVTHLGDSLDENFVNNFQDQQFDIIIDAGCHHPRWQAHTFVNFFPKLKYGGYYVIEDTIGGEGSTENIAVEYWNLMKKTMGISWYENRGNHFVVRKGYDGNLASDVLHHIGQTHGSDLNVVQIGAMDGINFDDTRGFLDMYRWDALLVEPVPHIFDELKKNFSDRPNYLFERAAITDFDGEIEMLTLSEGVIEKNDLHPGYKGMSALYPLKNGFGTDYERDIYVRDNLATNIKVPALTFESLLKKHSIEEFDILICDAEGHDWNIFQQIDLKKYRPKFIRLEYINLTNDEKELVKIKLRTNGYYYHIDGQDIDAVSIELFDSFFKQESVKKVTVKNDSNLTIISGLWNLGRNGRDFDEHYLPRFQEFLRIPHNMILFLPENLHGEVWKVRNRDNTLVVPYELSNVKHMYAPHWEKTQEIRTSEKWLNITGENGWLKSSPQATLEWYNPVVMSKMFLLHEGSIFNNFNTEYFIWLDAGITNTVPVGHLVEEDCLSKITDHLDPFLFLSYPYQSAGEIHGFDFEAMNRIAGEKVKYVCRGGLFGGKKEQISQANAMYYGLLESTLDQGHMGTEESIFTLMSYISPYEYQRYALDDNGLIVKFTEALLEDTVRLENAPGNIERPAKIITDTDVEKVKTNLYVLTFNFPEQLQHLLDSLEKNPDFLEKPRKILFDNSTNEDAKVKNKEIADKYGFEYHSFDNIGITGGRQKVAEHFHDSDADFMMFFEDDMTLNGVDKEGEFCRNGFRKYIPDLYKKLHKVIMRGEYDFVKLSFTEVFMDNHVQCAWYNIPQEVRKREFPTYHKLPQNGLDPNAPLTKFKNIHRYAEVNYIDGDIYYANWPLIASKAGNEKMFIKTKWAYPNEATIMSHIFQETLKGEIRPAVLLASPVWHDRIHFYGHEERKEC